MSSDDGRMKPSGLRLIADVPLIPAFLYSARKEAVKGRKWDVT